MKIWLISSMYLPHIGGVEMVVNNLAKELSARECQVEVIASKSSGLAEREVIDGVSVERIYLGLPGNSLKSVLAFIIFFPQTLLKLRQFVRIKRPDLINLHFVDAAGIYALFLKKLAKVPFVVSIHGNDIQKFPRESRLQRWILRRVLKKADFVTSCSQSLLQDAQKEVPEIGEKSLVTGNGVDIDEFDSREAYQAKKPYLFALGRLEHKKGFDVLLKAFKIVSKEQPDVNLILGGDGAERPVLERMIQELALSDKVKLMGKLERGMVVGLFKGCEFFVLPSRIEPLGIVNLEAMVAGKAVVATRVDGVPEIVAHQDNGILVESENSQSLAQGILFLLKNRKLRDEMGKRGRKLAESEYTWARITDKYFQVFTGLTS